VPSRSPTGDDRGWIAGRLEFVTQLVSSVDSRPRPNDPRRGGFHALPVARRRRPRLEADAIGFETACWRTSILACGRAGAHKGTPLRNRSRDPPQSRRGGFHALPVAHRRRLWLEDNAFGFETACQRTSFLACGRAGAHKRLPYGAFAPPPGRCWGHPLPVARILRKVPQCQLTSCLHVWKNVCPLMTRLQ
jgi:hypothetical protein